MTARGLALVLLKVFGLYTFVSGLGSLVSTLSLRGWSGEVPEGFPDSRALFLSQAGFTLALLAFGILLLVNTEAGLLAIFFLIYHAANAAYAALESEPSGAFVLLAYLGAAALVANWVRADCRRLGQPSLFDEGFFILIAWPLALPYYLLNTRGPRGTLAVLGFAALYLATFVLASALHFLVWHLISLSGGRA